MENDKEREILRLGQEAKEHLLKTLVPFWMGLRDNTYGGYYGWVDYDLSVDRQAVKGCILNSRILWFFSNVYALCGGALTGEELERYGISGGELLDCAKHAYRFLKEHCLDREHGGIYWSMTCGGQPYDDMKHTYNQAFAIYALSSYYDAAGDPSALELARALMELIETKCRDENGYLEAFTVDFLPAGNEKLSENGVMAERTMNTLLHVLEAYTELYRVSGDAAVRKRLIWMLGLVADKIYNPALRRQEVFFDKEYNSLIDLHSYGHDIETAWLVDRTLDLLGDAELTGRLSPITRSLTEHIRESAFDGHSLANECERGVVNEHRIWWVQAEAVVGFYNGYERTGRREYLDAALAEWEFIKRYVADSRPGSEWYWEVDKNGAPFAGRPIVEQWKCPYHNGRMCMELIKRIH